MIRMWLLQNIISTHVLECYPTRRVNKEGIVVTEGMSGDKCSACPQLLTSEDCNAFVPRIQYFLESIGIIIRDSAIWLRPAPLHETESLVDCR